MKPRKPHIDELLEATNQYGIEVRRAFNLPIAEMQPAYDIAQYHLRESLAAMGLEDYFSWKSL